MTYNQRLDRFEELFGERPKESSPKTWHALGRELRWWHICDLIEQKERDND